MAGQSQQQNSDNSLAMLWGVSVALAVIVLSWWFFRTPIIRFVLLVRWYEMRLISLVIPELQSTLEQFRTFHEIHHIEIPQLIALSYFTGSYLSVPVAFMLIGFSIIIYFNQASLRFKKHYNMQSLAKAENKNWVQITPVVDLDLITTDINQGPWAMALTPIQFAQEKGLLDFEPNTPNVATSVTVINDNYYKAKLRREATQRAFVVQLGDLWESPHTLPLPTKALFAIFAARAARDRPAADHLLWQIARSANNFESKVPNKFSHKLNFSGTELLLNKHLEHPEVKKTIRKHAYVLTVMASMLLLARQDGVLASSEFLWLKPCDRSLWFMLNCVGRQTAYSEVSGPFGHWLAEYAVGHRLQVPMVETAVDALDIALKDVRVSIEEENE